MRSIFRGFRYDASFGDSVNCFFLAINFFREKRKYASFRFETMHIFLI
ncbi:MAG: hypothetical protein AVDCRST_MAG74-2124 [uncultured Pyrinomonadaceae bacterium]|uniref:Uncharacterized protein n=1 Tax=uncultured Pyrinomonadaceae bacterium TaxID=2283094 RepID=A0A6J4P895_9BACT|nr:MAG: hypothetical protein AVDCRST_MAG74-2124 [uncultured Pyrinomonadaceae bacterium]